MCTVNEGAVCTSPTENSNLGGGYKVTAVTSWELVVFSCEALKLLIGSELSRTERQYVLDETLNPLRTICS